MTKLFALLLALKLTKQGLASNRKTYTNRQALNCWHFSTCIQLLSILCKFFNSLKLKLKLKIAK